MTSRLVFLACSFVVAATAPGCSSPAGACTGPATFANVRSQILTPSCASFSVCHNGSLGTAMGGLDLDPSLTDDQVFSHLVGAATQCMPNCVSARGDYPIRVVPGDPTHSFLWVKVSMPNGTDPKYGDRMPASNNPPLDSSCLGLIHDWIASLPADAGVPDLAAAPDAATPADAGLPPDASPRSDASH